MEAEDRVRRGGARPTIRRVVLVGEPVAGALAVAPRTWGRGPRGRAPPHTAATAPLATARTSPHGVRVLRVTSMCCGSRFSARGVSRTLYNFCARRSNKRHSTARAGVTTSHVIISLTSGIHGPQLTVAGRIMTLILSPERDLSPGPACEPCRAPHRVAGSARAGIPKPSPIDQPLRLPPRRVFRTPEIKCAQCAPMVSPHILLRPRTRAPLRPAHARALVAVDITHINTQTNTHARQQHQHAQPAAPLAAHRGPPTCA